MKKNNNTNNTHNTESKQRKDGNTMKDTTKKTTTPESGGTFAALIATYNADPSNADTLQALATACAYSVLKKCIDTSGSAVLVKARQSIAHDTATQRRTAYASANAYETTYNAEGDTVRKVKDKDLAAALADLCAETYGEGFDLVQDAIVAIQDETTKQAKRDPDKGIDLERPYTARRLKRKVWIKTAESVNGWETVTTTPIQEVYKAVRRAIQASRAAQTDPRSGYTYIADISNDPESDADAVIYRRFGKYADIGGYVTDINGKETAYTADETTAADLDTLLEKLNLSKQQAEIIALRLAGYGKKAIATRFGVRDGNIENQLKRIRQKAIDIGLTPPTLEKK